MLTHGDMTIYTYLQKQVQKYKDKPFICYKDEEITYQYMLTRSNQTASWLLNYGIKKGDTIAVMTRNSPFFYDLWFGCAAIGAIILPINTASTVRELQYLLEHSDSKAFLYEEELITEKHLEMAYDLSLLIYQTLSMDWRHECSRLEDLCHDFKILASDVCAIMYTSGTTSKPKGVLITHENYLYAGHSSVLYQALTPEDRYLIFLPLFHVNSQYYTSMAAFVAGGTICLLEKFCASTFWDEIQRLNPTVSSFVATIIKILIELPSHPYEKNHHIRQVGYGLFVNKNDIRTFTERFGIKLIQWYGMTESITTNIVTPLYEDMPEDPDTGIMAMGKPGLGQEIKIVDENSNVVPAFEVGQIIVKSPSLMQGYYKNEIETNKTIQNGWLYTGDKGYRNKEGFIWFVDRDKDLIKRAGENVSSIEIENVISSYQGVADCAVIGIPDNLREEAIIAYISTDGSNISEEEIRAFCAEQLSRFKVPQEFKFVEEFPRTSIGKIQKNLLRQNHPIKI